MTKTSKLLMALTLTAAFLTATSPAAAGTKYVVTPNGCGTTGYNYLAANNVFAAVTRKDGGTCHTVQVNFRYYDTNTGVYKTATSSYVNAVSVTKSALTQNQPSLSNHNNQSVSGGTKWGYPVSW